MSDIVERMSSGKIYAAHGHRKLFEDAIAEIKRLRATPVDGDIPVGLTKQDVVNLVDLALSDSLVDLGNGDGSRFDYDIFIAKLRSNGLCLRAIRSGGKQ